MFIAVEYYLISINTLSTNPTLSKTKHPKQTTNTSNTSSKKAINLSKILSKKATKLPK
jgi:hypothetical protein